MKIDTPNAMQQHAILQILGDLGSIVCRLTNDGESDKRFDALPLFDGNNTKVFTYDEAREAIRMVCQFGLDEIRIYREKTSP